MMKLLKRLSASCWGDHEWMYRTGPRGLWLECRACGHVSAGLDLPPAQYHRTQEAVPAAHRIGGVPPAQLAAAAAESAATSKALARTLTSRAAESNGEAAPRPVLWLAPVATTEAERRWLQAWRSMTADERAIAERLVARLGEDREVRIPHAS